MKIIAVDDEKLALETLETSVAEAAPDAVVRGFLRPSDALAYVEKEGCDVVFLDIKMRGITGIDLAGQIRKICPAVNVVFVTGYSDFALDAFRLYASDYILKPADVGQVRSALGHLRNPPKESGKKIRIRCFGNFDVFADGKPVVFRRAKAKELLAYLVDRAGATCSMGELSAVIWEDGRDTPSRQSNLRNLIHELRRSLAVAGAEELVVKGHNAISVDPTKAECDYFDFLNGVPGADGAYRGEYMKQYSWAELTAAALGKQQI